MKIVNPTDVGSLLGTPMLRKKTQYDSDYPKNNYHFTPNTRLAGCEVTKKESSSTDEPRDSTQSSDNTSSETPSARKVIDNRTIQRVRSDRPWNDKAKSTHCLYIWNWTNMTECRKNLFISWFWKPCLPQQWRHTECYVWKWATSHTHSLSLSATTRKALPEYVIQIANGNIVPQKKSPTQDFSCRQNFWRNLHRIANRGQNPHWHIFFQVILNDSWSQKQLGPFPGSVITAQDTSWELQLWRPWTESPPERSSRPTPKSYGAKHHSNRTWHLLRNHWCYSCFHHPKVWLHNDSAMNDLRDARTNIEVTHPNADTSTHSQGAVVANFKILTTGQAKNVRPMSLEQLSFVSSHPKEANNVINKLFQTPHSLVYKRWH